MNYDPSGNDLTRISNYQRKKKFKKWQQLEKQ